MRPNSPHLRLLSVLLLGIVAALPLIAEKPGKQFSAALERALDRSDYAVKRRAAELRDVSDSEWTGFPGQRSLEAWRQSLTPKQFAATRDKAADEPFSGQFVNHTADGTYHCTCGNPLFHSDHKVDSGTGFPSFSQAKNSSAVVTDLESEWSQENDQIELACGMCGAHLGHVHPGESSEEALSFRVNSSALDFRPTTTSSESD